MSHARWRLAARGVAQLAVVSLWAGAAAAQTTFSPDRALAREILEELVEIPTTQADGSNRAAQALAARLIAAGFANEDVIVTGPNPQSANLVARYRGQAPSSRALLLMAHLDVVPARREDWSLDPFTFVERDGWFYGRGASDNKAGAAVLVASFIALKRAGWRPERDVIVVLTGDEETSQDGIKWLLSQRRALVDAELAFNTDGGSITLREGVPAFFDLQASEKVYADYQLEVADSGGHSSLARPGNPIYTLSAALSRIGEHLFPLHVSDLTRLYLERTAQTETGQTAIDMRAVAAVPPDTAAAARLSRSPYYNARLRTTCVATRVEAGHANNALPQLARAVVNCRILPGLPPGEVETVLQKLAGDKVKVTVVEPPVPSPPSPLPAALLTRIERVAARHFAALPVIPTMLAGATDGMYTRNAGIPTYGMSALNEDPDDVRAHGKDERVNAQSFFKAAEFWLDLVKEFGNASP